MSIRYTLIIKLSIRNRNQGRKKIMSIRLTGSNIEPTAFLLWALFLSAVLFLTNLIAVRMPCCDRIAHLCSAGPQTADTGCRPAQLQSIRQPSHTV